MIRKLLLGLAGLAVVTGAVFASSHAAAPHKGAIKARQSVMQLRAHYLGQLGAMAKEETPYDAEAAANAAANLALVNTLDQSMMWPKGSDNASVENTRALPAIWTDGGIGAKANTFNAAVEAMKAAAGSDLAALRAAIGPLGKACGACHEDYRQSNR
jgi:cytochrome c556